MNTVPMKRCTSCQKEYPATPDYFYPSHLKAKGKNQCKQCHAATLSKSTSKGGGIREKLLEIAQPIEQTQLSLYRTFNTIANRLGCTQVWVMNDISNDIFANKKPVFKCNYNKTGMSLALTKEDAEAYISSKNQHEFNPSTALPEPVEKEATPLGESRQPIGTPFQCGACGTTEGNIICDVDKITGAWRGYLCASCHRSVRLIRDYFQGDPQRIPLVLVYVEQTSDIQ